MGQKINPIGLRLGINRGWDSTWFAKKKEFGKYLIEDFKMREYIKKNIINSGVSEIIIDKAQETGTHAVIKSAHLDLLTPLVSLLGFDLKLHQRTTWINVIK